MSNYFVLHGTKSYPREGWIFWFRDQLQEQGRKVFLPDFPSPYDQSLENWMRIFEAYKPWLDEESILIAHSRGVPFMLNVLEDQKVKQAIFISGWGEGEHDFFPHQIDYQKVIANCPNRLVIHAPDDPLVPYEKGKKLADLLDCELLTIEKGGHFNPRSGYTEFSELFDLLK